ncbi:MAG: YbgC/FadM family acyl-CoA thioesterase [Alphaproteobacteria bacterium]|jgi:acyl-CoA thioester hydrolase|nr:YbgC/FadM family acyl-CoA thioesterase [Alphaproteobacteria bacterium]
MNKREIDKTAFNIPITIYWEDTDAGGIVYHSSYINFAERSRTEWLRQTKGIAQSQLMQELGVGLVVKLMDVDYLAPAKLDDILRVSCKIEKVGITSIDISQEIWNEKTEKKLVQINVKIVSVNRIGKPVPIPQKIK